MKILITGGAGFIGSNLARRCLETGAEVVILDNLSRKGTEANLDWIKSLGGRLVFHHGDVRNMESVRAAMKGVDAVFHLAAQVAVTTSVLKPRHDFEVNLEGSFNVLESARHADPPPLILFTSTNKVYGKMDGIPVVERNGRWEYRDLPTGNPETTPLDFYSPYGCSKGSADQYILDYARIYCVPSIVFRMSCIYGPRQMGCEDQGWVAYFLIQAVLRKPITLYGDGKQIRDVLYVDDLIDAMMLAVEKKEVTSGHAYNIGGGPERTVSLLEFIEFIQSDLNLQLPYSFDEWRPGDQKVYVSDIRKADRDFGWKPRYSPGQGFKLLHDWIDANRNLFGQSEITR
ncbi:SDR family NAD(P)-dependent oxidoreductase [bacterium]|nr:SDR family NAD(P)-dependent oxidoreductase [candidate division CSSED10-310 bacterium]